MQNNARRDWREAERANVSPSARRRGANTGATRRPSGFSMPDAARPGTPAPPPPRSRQKRFESKRSNKRRRNERQPGLWKIILLAVGAALIVAFLVALISAATRGAYHQLPKVTRIEDYTPEPTATLTPGASPEAPASGSAGEAFPFDASSTLTEANAAPPPKRNAERPAAFYGNGARVAAEIRRTAGLRDAAFRGKSSTPRELARIPGAGNLHDAALPGELLAHGRGVSLGNAPCSAGFCGEEDA